MVNQLYHCAFTHCPLGYYRILAMVFSSCTMTSYKNEVTVFQRCILPTEKLKFSCRMDFPNTRQGINSCLCSLPTAILPTK